LIRGSGDYAVAFTANPACRLRRDGSGSRHVELLRDEDLSPLLLEADSEADPASCCALRRDKRGGGDGRGRGSGFVLRTTP
jgi:hypothetical protein